MKYWKKVRYFVLILSFIFFFFINPFVKEVYSNNNFTVNAHVTYEVQKTGSTKVTNNISLENKTSEIYAKQYVYRLENIIPQNIKVTENGESLDFKINKKDYGADIVITFESSLTGKGSVRDFEITYTNDDLATRTGEVWEISIPKIINSETFNEFNVKLIVPDSLGNEAYMSPQPKGKEDKEEENVYTYSKDQISNIGISAGFGKFQVFSFNLNYHLQNDESSNKTMEIAIPPDTSLQRVHYESIDPSPENVKSDEDGNWIASYILSGSERLDVSVKGIVQIFSTPRSFLIPPPVTLLSNTKSTDLWQSNEEAIMKLAEQHKTPRSIYDYVVSTLTYNASAVGPDVERQGAIGALRDPKNALCMEYTDLFIAIARAAGIPAREVNGFAYTENPNIQPLSLVSDVLHSWPEYWDKESNTWVAVDPTWASTSGVDYFDKLDLRHFAFVMHGKDSTKPYPPGAYKLGNNPQKDVYVSFGQLPTYSSSNIEVKSEPSGLFNLLGKQYTIEVKNVGNIAEYNIDEQVIIDSTVSDKSFIQILPPYGKYEDSISVRYGLFASKAPESILVSAGNNHLRIPIDKNSIIVKQLLTLSIILIILVIILHPKRPKIRGFLRIKRNEIH